jgi:hypothetical protein
MAELTAEQRRRVQQYLSLDTDNLVALIPTHLPAYQGAMFSPSGQTEVGWKEFNKLKSTLSQVLCVQWGLCHRIKSEQFKDAISLISAMADVIAVHSGFVPPFLASTIIFRMGVRQLCNCPES